MSNHLYDGVFAPHADSTKTFLYTADRDISFAEFTALTDRIAAMLVAQGLAPGDRVAVQANKSVLLFALYAATVKAAVSICRSIPAIHRPSWTISLETRSRGLS